MELFFDDNAIDRTAGVRKVLGTPKKEPDPILEPQLPWETAGSSAFHAVLRDRDSGRFRLWYRASIGGADRPAGEEAGPERNFLCYAESADGRPSPTSTPGEACAPRYWTRSAAWCPDGTARPQDRSRQPTAACDCGGRDRSCADSPARPATPGGWWDT